MRYIDADKLKKDICIPLTLSYDETVWLLNKTIDDQPTADVRENVRGEWIVEKVWEHGETLVWKCSKCGKETTIKNCNFCPNCGADMRGERKEKSVDEDDIQPHVCSTCHWCLNDWHQEPCNICAYGSKWKDGR